MNKPSAPKKTSRSRTLITLGLMSIWLFLMIFALIAAIEPPWLKRFSREGIAGESRVAKDYGDSHLYQKNYESAIINYRRALEIMPDNMGALINLGVACSHSGKREQGLKILQDALRKGSRQSGTIYFNIAEIMRAQGKSEQAVEFYLKSAGSEVDQAIVYCNLGTMYMELNDLDNARTAFEKALQIQTDPTTPYRHMIKANLAFNEDEGDSLIIFERMNQRDIRPEDLEDYDLATIEAIIDNDPEISKTINDLGLISARRGEINGAIAYFEQSLQIWPSNSAAKKNLQALKQLKK